MGVKGATDDPKFAEEQKRAQDRENKKLSKRKDHKQKDPKKIIPMPAKSSDKAKPVNNKKRPLQTDAGQKEPQVPKKKKIPLPWKSAATNLEVPTKPSLPTKPSPNKSDSLQIVAEKDASPVQNVIFERRGPGGVRSLVEGTPEMREFIKKELAEWNPVADENRHIFDEKQQLRGKTFDLFTDFSSHFLSLLCLHQHNEEDLQKAQSEKQVILQERDSLAGAKLQLEVRTERLEKEKAELQSQVDKLIKERDEALAAKARMKANLKKAVSTAREEESELVKRAFQDCLPMFDGDVDWDDQWPTVMAWINEYLVDPVKFIVEQNNALEQAKFEKARLEREGLHNEEEELQPEGEDDQGEDDQGEDDEFGKDDTEARGQVGDLANEEQPQDDQGGQGE